MRGSFKVPYAIFNVPQDFHEVITRGMLYSSASYQIKLNRLIFGFEIRPEALEVPRFFDSVYNVKYNPFKHLCHSL